MKTSKHRRLPNFAIQAESAVSIPRDWNTVDQNTSVDIQAASDGEADGPLKFFLMANTGRPMMLEGFLDPVIIDLSGAKFDHRRTPVIADHDTTRRIGHSTEQAIIPAGGEAPLGGRTVKGPAIVAVGQQSSSMGVSQGFAQDARAGFPFQVSVGATTVEAFFVEAGEKVEVNGRSWKGPLVVAAKSVVRELSIVVLGADSRTQATITASRRTGKDNAMNFEDFVRSLHLDPAKLTDAQATALKAQWKAQHPTPTPAPATPPADPDPAPAPAPIQAATPGLDLTAQRQEQAQELRRTSNIQATASRFADVTEVQVEGQDQPMSMMDFQAHAINSGMNADTFELHLLRAHRPAPSGPAIHVPQQVRDMDNATLSCALVRSSRGVPMNATHEQTGERWGVEHWYPEQVLQASDNRTVRNLSLHQLMDLTIQAAGGYFAGNRRSDDFIQATRDAQRKLQAASGFSTLNVSNIFEDAANKLLLSAYQGAATTWQEWAGVRAVNDFKTHNLYRLTSKGAYQQVGADGELKHGGWTDDKYTVQADTYGKIVGLTRKHLINDDLDAFRSIMSSLGLEGAKTVEELAYMELLGNLATLFPTAGTNNNYISGAGSDLTIAGLSLASQTFEDQVDADNAPLMIEPDRILVGTQDRVQAGNLFNQTEVREGPSSTSTKKEFTRNPHTGAFRPIVSGYLNNTNIKQRVANVGTAIPGQSSDQWLMFPNPNMAQGAAIMVAFLNGNRLPFLENADSSFNVLGAQWRAYHDVGTGQGDPKLGVHSKGAA